MAIIDVKKERRRGFVEGFLQKGFYIDKRLSKEEIIKSALPITIDFKAKEIGRMGNVTCAAAAVSQGCILSEEKFSSVFEKTHEKYQLGTTLFDVT